MNITELFEKKISLIADTTSRKETFISNISKYFDNPNAFLSYQHIPKVGINPVPHDFGTPVGYYAYPLRSKVIQKQFLKGTLPYGVDSPYAIVIIADCSNELTKKIKIKPYAHRMFESVLSKLDNKDKTVKFLFHSGYSQELSWQAIWDYFQNKEMLFCDYIRMGLLATKLLDRNSDINNPSLQNIIYRSSGAEILTDLGEGAIHVEPYQSIFLTTKPIKDFEIFKNHYLGNEDRTTDIFGSNKELIKALKSATKREIDRYDLSEILIDIYEREKGAYRLKFLNKSGVSSKIILSQQDVRIIIGGDGWDDDTRKYVMRKIAA